jgi:hypothetical protein
MSSSQFYAILPIFNKEVLPKFSLPWVLSEDLLLKTGEDIEKLLLKEDNSIVFPVDEVCNEVFHISLPGEFDDSDKNRKLFEESIKLDALSLQTVFNLVGLDETMTIPYGIVIEKAKVQKLKYVVDF